jgi:PilZ domain
MPPAAQPERRRSPRRLLDVPLIVRGESAENQPFREETFTISVSAHGALVLLATKVSLGQTLILVKPETRQEQEGRVSRLGSLHGGLAQVAVEFSQPVPEFWPDSLSLV